MGAMRDLVAGGLAAIRQAHGVSITVLRGAYKCPIANVGIGRSSFVSQDDGDEGGAVTFETRDYLIGVSDYKFDNVPCEPLEGDRIQETINGKVLTFRVSKPAGEPEFKYSDSGRTQYRVHVEAIDEVNATDE